MNIDEIETSLNNLKGDPNKTLAVIFELAIRNQAIIEETLIIQNSILEAINKDNLEFQYLHTESKASIDKRIDELRAILISKII